MSEEYHYDKLVLLNQVYQQTLKDVKEYDPIPGIKTKLFVHQQQLIQGMHHYRMRMTNGFMIQNEAINSKMGIVGDGPGTGKTLAILAYLASITQPSAAMSCELTHHSSKYFFSHELYPHKEPSSHLIIVPHHLFTHWQHEFQQHTTLSYLPIETKRALKEEGLLKKITTSRIILTTNKCYKMVQEYADTNHLSWDHIIVDEAASIYMKPSDPAFRFQFLWFMTHNWIPLLFKTPSIHKSTLLYLKDRVEIHSELVQWLEDCPSLPYESTLVSSAFLKEYLPFFHSRRSLCVLRTSGCSHPSLPLIKESTLMCRPTTSFNALCSFFLVRNREPRLTSAQIPQLFQGLGIVFQSLNEYLPMQPSNRHIQIVTKTKENECVICLESCEYPTMVNCCYNVYCGKCLLQHVIMHPKCPTCREVIQPSSMNCLSTLTHEETLLARNKLEVCIDLLEKNPMGQVVIYSSFDNVYYQLFEEMNRLGWKAERIENNLFYLRKTMKNFQDRSTRILFISNVDAIRGLSLTSTTHLIFYHELPSYEWRQVLLHSCQRVGREGPLTVLHLKSEIPI